MNKKLKFQDSLVVEHSIPAETRSDAHAMLKRDRNASLKVQIDATHSGVLTNMRVYPGRYVREGHKSFYSKDRGGTAEYDKPILKHHDDTQDAIGRVIDSQFTQLKHGDYFDQDFLGPEDVGGRGSGVVTITGLITDQDSIQKIIDSRYMSVSVRHSTPIYLCSVCGDDIMDCEHTPGGRYSGDSEQEDGSLCYLITGPLTYSEVSFVNVPAQPPAKLINFNWTESKDSWMNNVITTQISGKKETVRSFSLCDEDGELSLLSGKKNQPKKTVIAVSPAVADKLKHALSSEEPKVADVNNDIRRPDNGRPSVVSDVEQNLEKAKNLENSTEVNEMDNSKELADLKTEVQSLKDQLATATTKIKELEKQVEAKDSQVTRLTTDATAMQTRMVKSLASQLAGLRIRLNKPGSEGVDTKEKLDAYVASFATRSVDSLQDSLEDLLHELKTKTEEPKVLTAEEILANDKLNSPAPAKGAKPKATTADNKKSNSPTRAVDKLADVLGIKE